MQITSAQFGFKHRKKSYMVDMTVQDTSNNRRRAVVTVTSGETGKTLYHESMWGRQLICSETAKTAIREAIKAEKKGRAD